MAWALVANTGAGGSPNGVTTSGIVTTGANLIVINLSWYNGVTPGGALTDSLGNTWTGLAAQVGSGTGPNPNFLTNQLLYCVNPTVGVGHTFSYNGTSMYPSIQVQAWSGAASVPFDVQNGALSNAVVALNTGSVTPGVNGELIVAGLSSDGGTTSVAINSGFTVSNTNLFVAGSSEIGSMAYLVQGTAAAVNPQWTLTVMPVNGVNVTIASFKVASSTGAALSANANAQPSSSAALTTTIALAASASATPQSTASLTANGQSLLASASATPSSSASLTTNIALAATASASPQGSGTLATAGVSLAASASAKPSSSASLTTVISLSASASASPRGSGTLATTPLFGAAAVQTDVATLTAPVAVTSRGDIVGVAGLTKLTNATAREIRVDSIAVKSKAGSAAANAFIWLFDGSVSHLLTEIPLPASAPGNTLDSTDVTKYFQGGFNLMPSQQLYVSVSVSIDVNAFCFGVKS